MPIKTPQEFFIHDLCAAYYSEHVVLKAMNEMVGMAKTDRVKRMLQDHIKESEQQVKNLEQCFSELGQRPWEVKCWVADGLVQDFHALAKEIQDPSMIDLCILGAMDKTEHLETATYRGLINKAKLLGHTKVAQILTKIESGEEKECELVETADKDLGKQLIGKIPHGPTTTRPRVGF